MVTLIKRKSRVLSFKASKGEAVVAYREPLATQKMECYRLYRRVSKMKNNTYNDNSSIEDILNFRKHTKYGNYLKTLPMFFI